jgi:hypothetical protein
MLPASTTRPEVAAEREPLSSADQGAEEDQRRAGRDRQQPRRLGGGGRYFEMMAKA